MNRREALRRTAAITGVAVSSSVSIAFLKGCSPSGKPSWPPIFLKPEEIQIVSAIADTILPKTDTPGALDVSVPEFIDLMLRDIYGDDEKATFRAELKAFNDGVDSKYGNPFHECTKEEQSSIIGEQEEAISSGEMWNGTRNFYHTLKQITLLGFFTSEQVMTTMLDYNPIPGRQEGCIPLGPDGRVYVDNNV